VYYPRNRLRVWLTLHIAELSFRDISSQKLLQRPITTKQQTWIWNCKYAKKTAMSSFPFCGRIRTPSLSNSKYLTGKRFSHILQTYYILIVGKRKLFPRTAKNVARATALGVSSVWCQKGRASSHEETGSGGCVCMLSAFVTRWFCRRLPIAWLAFNQRRSSSAECCFRNRLRGSQLRPPPSG